MSFDPVNLFNVTVLDEGVEVETLSDMSLVEGDESFIENAKSSNLTFEIVWEGIPKFGAYSLSGGADGIDGMTDADYIGNSANSTGLYAFDEVTDAIQLAAPGISSPAVITSGLAYCENRGDLLFITETPFNLSSQEAVDFRLGSYVYTDAPLVSNYGAMYYPKIKVYDVAGSRRGRVLNALGVDVNVGGRGRLGEGNYICENQVNPVCVFEDTGSVVWGAQTLQRQASLLREVNVRRMLIIVKKTVAAYARAYIHQPNDPRTWREFYRGLEPKFREWKAQRWFYDYRIFCDQDAQSLDDAKLNIPESVQRGEFKCQIFVKPVVGIKWVMIDAAITRLDANFDESLADVIGAA